MSKKSLCLCPKFQENFDEEVAAAVAKFNRHWNDLKPAIPAMVREEVRQVLRDRAMEG